LTDSNAALSITDTLPTPPDREQEFIKNLFLEPNPYQAAIKAGYSESYSVSTLYTRLKNPKFQERIREYARSHELVNSVPLIMRLENKALKYLEDKPQELPKFASILKQKKQIAGLLSQDVAPQQAMISIGHVANMMLNVSQSTPQHVVNVVDNKDNIISVDSKLL
jgi:phage terminase small subunit